MAPSAAGPHSFTVAATATDLVVTVDGVTTSRALADTPDGLAVMGGAGNDSFAIDPSAAGVVPVTFDGGAGTDTVFGPSDDTTWSITGVGAGHAAGVTFLHVEWLRGAANNKDTFVLKPGGSLVGGVDGGDGGFDSLVVDGQRSSVVSQPVDAHSGTLVIDGVPIVYRGLEPITLGGPSVTVNGTSGDDPITISASGSNIIVSSPTFESITLPRGSTLTVDGLGGTDSVTISGSVLLAALTVNAETITLPSGASVTTTGAVTFAALAQNPDALTPAALTAAVSVNGGLTAGATQLTAATEQTLVGRRAGALRRGRRHEWADRDVHLGDRQLHRGGRRPRAHHRQTLQRHRPDRHRDVHDRHLRQPDAGHAQLPAARFAHGPDVEPRPS